VSDERADAPDDRRPDLALAQPVIDDDDIRRPPGFAQGLQGRVAGPGDQHLIAPPFQHHPKARQHHGVVIDDQRELARRCRRSGSARRHRRDRLGRPERHVDGEHRPLAGLRTHPDRVVQEPGQALYDGQPKAQALRTVTLGVGDLVELLEDALQVLLRDADAGVAHLDARGAVGDLAPAADLAALGVAKRVLDEVADHAPEQHGVGAHGDPARPPHAQAHTDGA